MIVFDLICKEQHRFEGWFSSGEDFSSQQSRGLLECPVCGGSHVEKLPAARIRKLAESVETESVNPPVAAKPESLDVAKIIDYLLTHSDNVGRNFAAEARRIHNREAEQRNIRGVATPEEADDLREEGIPVFSLPVPPQDRWN